MHQFCGVQRGFVYRYSSTRELLVLTGSTPGAFAGRQFHSSLPLRNSEVEQFSAGTTCPVDRLFANPGGLIDGPDQVIPLMVDGAYAGFFLLWGDELLTGNTETIQNLRLGIDVLARRISTSRLRLQADYMIRRNRLQEAVKAIAASTVNSQEKVAGVLRQIRTSISAETAALWIVEENQEFGTRFTVGGTGALLLEKGLPVPASLRTLSEERTRSRALVFEGANEEHSEFLRGAIGPQYQAGLVAPMGHAQPAASFLVAGYVRADEFIRQSATLLTSVIPFMLDIVNSLAGPERAVPVDRRLVLIERLLSSFRRTGDIDRLLERSSELLIHMTSVDAVRIVTVDPHGPYAISRGFAASVPLEPMIPERGAMVRTLMPCFQAALQTGRTICAGSDDREFSMSSAESRQLFDETIRAVAIVPIAGSQGLCGAVCLGQTDVSATFTRRRLQPVRTLALGLGLALEAASHENSLAETMTVGRPIPVGLREDLDLRSRVKSSLSGIFGSVELLKAQQESVDPQTERYLTIIDRSAKRINEYLGPQDVRTYTR